MSSFVNFYTFAQMENATIQYVSSEVTNYIAEHAIAPLEPSMIWQANEANAQHYLDIDLGAPHECSCLFWIHHETELDPTAGVTIELYWSHDATNWNEIALSGDDGITEKLLKIVTFTAQVSRYWRVKFFGVTAPNYYAPQNMKISVAWVGTSHALDVGPAFPIDDEEYIPSDTLKMPFDRIFSTGRNINGEITFNRQWMLREDSGEWSTLLNVIAECNGQYRPFVYDQSTNDHLFCRFTTDQFEETLIETDLFMVTCTIVATPVVQRNEYH